MKKKLSIIIVTLLIGYGLGIMSTNHSSAASNVLLASVEWVQSKITPLDTRITNLEKRVSSLETNSGTTPAPPPTNPGTPIAEQSSVITTKSVNVRKGAATSYEIFYTVPANTVLTYNSTFTNSVTKEVWYIVRLSDGRLGAVAGTHATVQVTPVTTFKNIVMTKNAPIRRGAASSYEVYLNAKPGAVYTYQSTFINSVTKEKWYIVKLPDGRAGCVLASSAEVMK